VTVVRRADVLDMLAGYGDRAVATLGEDIDSLELAWLLHQAEQRYGVALDLADEDLSAMSTVDGAVTVLRRAVVPT
jgi:acyl carrier protein